MLKEISLTCPFCSSEPRKVNNKRSSFIFVVCSNESCHANEMPIRIEYWNRRPKLWIPADKYNREDGDLLIKDNRGDVATFYYDRDLWKLWNITHYLPVKMR